MKMNSRSNLRCAAGFSLVELMLALALGLVVVTGIVQLFVGNSQTYTMLNGQARMQENARFALEFISDAARSTGFFGCAPQRNRLVNGLGGEFENIPNQEFDITQIIRANNNGVVFRSMQRPGWRLAETLQPDGNPRIVVPGGEPGFAVGDVVMVANCEQGAVFRVTGLNVAAGEAVIQHQPPIAAGCSSSNFTAGGNAQCVVDNVGVTPFVPYTLSLVSRAYGSESVLGALQNTEFFVAPGADGNQALWQRIGDGAANELISGVEALDILYGIDTADDGVISANRYLTFAELNPDDLRSVVALRVSVRVNSVEPVTPDGDMLRRTVSKTILLRNGRPEA